MAQEKPNLVPVFMPPLALILANAEQKKGSRLTEPEVLRIRDSAPCIMMEPDHATQMIESRGYRDIEPESCWADWHRLRVELTGDGYLPKLVLCLVGARDLPWKCAPILEAAGVEHEWADPDPWMQDAFRACQMRVEPSLTEQDWGAISKHQQVLFVLSSNYTSQDAPAMCRKFLELGRQLLEAGADALKCESSSIAHGKERWLELARDAEQSDPWIALFTAFVQYPIQNELADFYTCGMHLLGFPDLIVAESLAGEADAESDPSYAAVDLFLAFGLYLIGECAPGKFHSGNTFRVAVDSPRYRLVWEECTGYDEDDFFFNPFGRWRFTPA